jgi:hypothetical protein
MSPHIASRRIPYPPLIFDRAKLAANGFLCAGYIFLTEKDKP